MENDSKRAKKYNDFEPERYIIWVVAFVALILLGFYANSFKALSSDTAQWGQLGDYVGGLLNPLISMCTLYVAIRVWRLQKEELILTRDELKEARLASESQAETAKQQRREQRFFDLLNLYQNTSDALTYPCRINSYVTLTFQGKTAISEWLLSSHSGKFLNAFNKKGLGNYPHEHFSEISEKNLTTLWRSADVSDFISPYIRVVFNILAEADSILGDDHERYILFFRNQFSNAELFILCCHLYLDASTEKSRYLAERYELLKHLPHGKLREETEKILSLNVFGKQKVLA